MVAGALLAAFATAAAGSRPNPPLTVAAQALAGLGWALLPAGVFAVVALVLWQAHARLNPNRF